MKLSKRKNLLGFIYALVMLLPFSAILLRSLYVVLNDNSYKSYSGVSVGEAQYTYLTTDSEVDSTTRYYLDTNLYTQPSSSTSAYFVNLEVVEHINLCGS